MTYQEAYKHLSEAEILDLTQGDTKDSEAVNVAMKVLEQRINEPHWLAIATDENGMTNTFRCSTCGSYVYLLNTAYECRYGYCPECGVEMRSEAGLVSVRRG